MASEKSLLRILSCGSVDDGKSTLIGRILYDCGTLYEDQLRQLEKERTHEGFPDFSCLLDGLLAEREQAITIDVAYRSFRTETRRYIVADAPGHEQYTRNMVTGASNSDVALLLIDATRVNDGLLPQTIRHTLIASLIGIPDIVVAVNKMDRLDFSQTVFEEIEKAYREKIKDLSFRSVTCIPVSALKGDNVCKRSVQTPWYAGPTLLEILEGLEPPSYANGPFCMPVQWVARQQDFRGLSGTVLSGTLNKGSQVLLLPSGIQSTIKRIATYDGDLSSMAEGQAVCIQLDDDVDAGRGEVVVDAKAPLEMADQFAAHMIWLNDPPLVAGRSYIFRQGTSEVIATISELSLRFDLDSMQEQPARELKPNDIGQIKLSLNRPVPFMPYAQHRDLGGFLLVDRITGNTVGAGLIEYGLYRSHTIHWHEFELNKAAHAGLKNQKPCTIWFTGLSASGKSTLANMVAKMLYADGKHVYILDGDNLRHGLNRDLGFKEADRAENIRRAGEVARLMVDAGLIVLASFISPFQRDRIAVRERFESGEFYEIFVDTPIEVCIKRDPKGLYAQALAGKIPNFTGISAPFEIPEKPDLRLDGKKRPEELVDEVMRFLMKRLQPAEADF
ncbi:MAG: adenylyl-sulfate kinase [Betaproteobacteria bacterium]|nr:adenylyl-sulfate kinase [Betaproteobacteria bacterium]